MHARDQVQLADVDVAGDRIYHRIIVDVDRKNAPENEGGTALAPLRGRH
jgi:hypothetical protein